MQSPNRTRFTLALASLAVLSSLPARAAERVTLRSGRQLDCIRQEAAGEHIRLYLLTAVPAGDAASYVEVSAASIVSVETIPDLPAIPAAQSGTHSAAPLTQAEMTEMLARAGGQHNIDADLLASVIKAESNGKVLAVS